MPKKIGIATAGVITVGAVAAIIGLSDGDDYRMEARDVSESIKDKVFEKDVCSKAIRTPGGKIVRIVGVQNNPDAVVQDTDIGRTVIVDSPEDGLCHAMLDSPVKKKTEDDGVSCRKDYADEPVLFPHFGKASCPVMIPGSGKDKSFYWSVLLKGVACELAGDLQSFKGSDMHDYLKLPISERSRFMRTDGQCPVDGGFINCTVPVGDPRAVPQAPVWVPHRWSKRFDLNFVRAVKGKPELRYEIPDGGFEEAEIVEIP